MIPEEEHINPNFVFESFSRCLASEDFFNSFRARLFNRCLRVRLLLAGMDYEAQLKLFRSRVIYLLMYAKGNPVGVQLVQDMAVEYGRENWKIKPHVYNLCLETLLNCVRDFDPEYSDHTKILWIETLKPGMEFIIRHY